MYSQCRKWEQLSLLSLWIQCTSSSSWTWWSRLAETKTVLDGIIPIQDLAHGCQERINKPNRVKNSLTQELSLLSLIPDNQLRAKLWLMPSETLTNTLQWWEPNPDRQPQILVTSPDLHSSPFITVSTSTITQLQSTTERTRVSKRCCWIWTRTTGPTASRSKITQIKIRIT